MNPDLRREAERLSREIAFLQESLGRANLELEFARSGPIAPRGLVWGIVVGLLLTVGFVVVAFIFMMSAVLSMD